jgi:hypothetical protein
MATAKKLPTDRRETLPIELVEAIEESFASLANGCEMFIALSVPEKPRRLIHRGFGDALQDGYEMHLALFTMENAIIRRLGVRKYPPSHIGEDAMVCIQKLEEVVRNLVAARQVSSFRCTIIPTAKTQAVYLSDSGVPFTMNPPLLDAYGDEKDRFLVDRLCRS